MSFNLNYTHGWKAFEKSYKVTQTEGNEIITLDWRPALEVYLEALLEHTEKKLTLQNFSSYIKSYPFGILRMDSELIIRDPYTITERGGIKVVDKIEDGEYIRIMNGDAESLIKATSQLGNVASQVSETSQAYFCFSCISRKLFLKEKINEELEELCPNSLLGAFTIGEIVNEGKTYLEMYNKIIAKITI